MQSSAEFPPKHKSVFQDFMVSYPKRQKSSQPLLWES